MGLIASPGSKASYVHWLGEAIFRRVRRAPIHPVCPFCSPNSRLLIAENRYAFAMLDGFPLSKGHTLVIPRRHIRSVFEASRMELAAVWMLVELVHTRLVQTDSPAGFNIGINDGSAAGQTVSHLHVHIIPRYAGDVEDPRGGVRWILPAKANYWDRCDG